MQADKESNALVITAPASIFPSLRAVIQQLDIPRAQVHIEAIIAEVTLNTSKELGVQWLLRSSQPGAVGSSQFSTFGTTIGGIAGGIVDGVTDTVLPDGGILGLGNIDDDGLSIVALIRALQGDGETNLLSTPSLVTLDNQEAAILVGTKFPIIESDSTGGGVGAANVSTSLDYYENIGIQLNVIPQVSNEEYINMIVHPAVSSIDGFEQGVVQTGKESGGLTRYPVLKVREAQTQILRRR